MENGIYLDNAATTPMSEHTKRIMDRMSNMFGNPSSVHSRGREVRSIIDSARIEIKSSFGAQNGDIIFTASGSQANNLALLGIADHLKKIGKNTIITTEIEHPSVYNTCRKLEQDGFQIIFAPVNIDGIVEIDDLERLIEVYEKEVGLVTIQWVNSEIGSMQKVAEIGALCKQNGRDIIFHTDAVQATCCVDIDIDKCKIDMMSFSGHKIGTMKGIGGLYVADRSLLTPVVFGGGQEYGLVSGTENATNIACLASAVRQTQENISLDVERINDLKNYFSDTLSSLMDIFFWFNNTRDSDSGIMSLTIPKIEGAALMMLLDSEGVQVSNGSACSSANLSPSRVLTAIGLDDKSALCTIRISISANNKIDDVVIAANKIAELSHRLNGLSNGGEEC